MCLLLVGGGCKQGKTKGQEQVTAGVLGEGGVAQSQLCTQTHTHLLCGCSLLFTCCFLSRLQCALHICSLQHAFVQFSAQAGCSSVSRGQLLAQLITVSSLAADLALWQRGGAVSCQQG
jgi:hypothetical protein